MNKALTALVTLPGYNSKFIGTMNFVVCRNLTNSDKLVKLKFERLKSYQVKKMRPK